MVLPLYLTVFVCLKPPGPVIVIVTVPWGLTPPCAWTFTVVFGFLPALTALAPVALVFVAVHWVYWVGLQAADAVSAETATKPADSRNAAIRPEMSFFIGTPHE